MKRSLCIIVPLFLITGCASFSSYQTAETLTKDQFLIGSSLSIVDLYPDRNIFIEIDKSPSPEVFIRYVIFPKYDIGTNITRNGVHADIKYHIIKRNNIISSSSIGLGAISLNGNDDKSEYIFNYTASLFLTYSIGNDFKLTTIPKIIGRFTDRSKVEIIPGGLFSISFGKKHQFIPEIGYFKAERESYLVYGLGFVL